MCCRPSYTRVGYTFNASALSRRGAPHRSPFAGGPRSVAGGLCAAARPRGRRPHWGVSLAATASVPLRPQAVPDRRVVSPTAADAGASGDTLELWNTAKVPARRHVRCRRVVAYSSAVVASVLCLVTDPDLLHTLVSNEVAALLRLMMMMMMGRRRRPGRLKRKLPGSSYSPCRGQTPKSINRRHSRLEGKGRDRRAERRAAVGS